MREPPQPPPPPPFPGEIPKTRQADQPKVASGDLRSHLEAHLGFNDFRPHQEEVCHAAIAGEDLLLVMPTGSGKSLCYQLPGLVRGGGSLVISPLIALMEDQVAKLRSAGIAADRLHSGRDRDGALRAFQGWRDGRLDFLFVAPERLAVGSFLRLIEERPPNLVAVDEAHCISHWGHDFRPDYRLVGERLPRRRDTPIVALTATATPRVQTDIVEKLGIASAKRFIRGFRRTNLAVECVEAPPSSRHTMVRSLLENEDNRPALVYCPSRRETEELAAELSSLTSASAYHAGLPASTRDTVQESFLGGRTEIVVATIAFGMGVDKADIRTVVHTALPGTVEAYFQEIGRAGRDGKMSRAVLLWSWADRRTHEFFHGRDYPETTVLDRIFNELTAEAIGRDELGVRLRLAPDLLTSALNQLWIHGGALVDAEERAVRGDGGWRKTYSRQREHKTAQLEEICTFAGGRGCRMQALIGHFGDREDQGGDCRQCDHCAPKDCVLLRYRDATRPEFEVMTDILDILREQPSRTIGQLFRDTAEGRKMVRGDFEAVVDALVREDFVETWSDSFTKEGREIRFSRAGLTKTAKLAGVPDPSGVRMIGRIPSQAKSKKKTRRKTAPPSASVATVLTSSQERNLADLRSWRLQEARRRRVPAFRIMGDRTLEALVRARPSDEEELLDVSGIGPTLMRKYGKALLEILAGA